MTTGVLTRTLARAHRFRASQVTILVIGQVMLYYTMKWLLRQVGREFGKGLVLEL